MQIDRTGPGLQAPSGTAVLNDRGCRNAGPDSREPPANSYLQVLCFAVLKQSTPTGMPQYTAICVSTARSSSSLRPLRRRRAEVQLELVHLAERRDHSEIEDAALAS